MDIIKKTKENDAFLIDVKLSSP